MRSGAFLVVILAVLAGAAALLVFDGDGLIAGLRDDQFADLVYLGAWGAVVGAGLLFTFRGRFSEAVRNAGIWIAVFLVLIALYALAPDARSLGDRMMAALMPGRVAEIEGTDGRKVMIMRSGDDHFHVDAIVDGQPISFLVDTGASFVALDPNAARRIGIDPDQLRYTTRIMTANGAARAAPVFLKSIRIGGIERRDVPAAVIDQDGLGLSLLGMSYLRTLSSFDFRGERLILSD